VRRVVQEVKLTNTISINKINQHHYAIL